jgi:hypothetical protein
MFGGLEQLELWVVVRNALQPLTFATDLFSVDVTSYYQKSLQNAHPHPLGLRA